MKEIKLGKLLYEISRHNPPVLTIEPGETVSVETEDSSSGQLRKVTDRRDNTKFPYANPNSGPIFVTGADRGDTLSVHIEKIEAREGLAVTRTAGPRGIGEFLGMDPPQDTRVCPVKDGTVWWSPNVPVPYAPMIGTIGCPPANTVPDTLVPEDFGGNIDIKEVTEGNTIYLPVSVPGALLHLGDVHAGQGDGELCGTAFEMPATVTITIDLIKGKTIPRPRIRSPQEIMTVATGTPMERSMYRAYADLILWMEEEYGVPRWDGYNLCTQVATISIGYVAFGTVAAKIKMEYVEGAAKRT